MNIESMKKKIATVVAIIGITPFLVQCASQNDIKNLNYQLRIVNKKIEDMKMGTVGQMQQRQAASSSQIDEMRREILVLKGQLEELGHFNRQLKEQNKELETSLSQYSTSLQEQIAKERAEMTARDQKKEEKILLLEEKLAKNQNMLKSIQTARIKEAELKAKAAARAAEMARNKAKASSQTLASSSSSGIISITAEKHKKVVSARLPQNNDPTTVSPTPAVVTQTSSGDSSDLLSEADKHYANGNFKKAYSLYEKFTSSSSNKGKTITARFMMGECLFFMKEYDQAILQYQKIISNNPKHPRAASSLLKQGMAFENLSDYETAKIIYKKIVSSYPSSPESATAKERSNKIN